MPYRDDGTFYTTDPLEEIKGALGGDEASEKRVQERIQNAKKYSGYGGRLGSVVPLGGTAVGAALGAIGGFILGDKEIVFPIDMIAIPAYQAYLLQGTPAFQIFIRGGETLVPTGGNVSDVQEALNEPASLEKLRHTAVKRTRKPSAYSKKYSKAFDKVKGSYKLKSGKWKKDGFKRAVRAAHKLAKGGKK